LYKGGIPVQTDPNDVREAQAPRPAPSRLKMSKPEFNQATSSADVAQMDDTREHVPQQPIRKDTVIGRNEPCPCGSGKKYKNCHGAGL
jgi:preprotein translocase subunit SecA